MRTSISATGPAPAATAWERYAELDRWARWAPQITGVEAPARRLVTGLCGTVRAAGLLRVPFEVLAVDEAARTWTWRVRLGPVTLHLEHGVESLAPEGADPQHWGSRTWLRTSGPAAVVLPYTPIAFLALHFLVLDRGA